MSFDTFRRLHDPNAVMPVTFPFVLNPGEALAEATVDVVDPTSTTVDTDTDLVLTPASFGLISGTTYGVTTWVSGGSPGSYYLRCHVKTDSFPIARQADKTMELVCQQT